MPELSESEKLFALYTPLDGVRLNIAVDVSGAVSGAQGSSDDISNPLDRSLLVELRRQADVIVTTGATARAERIFRSKFCPIVIVTETASVEAYSPKLLDSETSEQPLYFFTHIALVNEIELLLNKVAKNLQVIGLPDLTPASILSRLRQLGFRRILLETGPTVSKHWLSAGCLNEVCLTTTGVPQNAQRVVLPNWLDGFGLEETGAHFSEKHRSLFQRFSVSHSAG